MRYNLNALRTFVVVAEQGSFSKAADRMAVTQGAVSQQIGRLENYLGAPLFERSPRQLQLTAQGQRLLKAVQGSIATLDGAMESARSHRAHEVLSVAALGSYAAKRLAPRLQDFERINPNVRIHCETSSTLVDFSVTEIDVAIRASNGPASWEGLHATQLFADKLVPVATPRFADTLRMLPDLQKFVQTPLFYDLDSPGDWAAWFAQSGIEDAQPNLARGFSDLLVCIAALLAGTPGIALVGESMIEAELADGALVRLSEVQLQPSRHYYVVHPANKVMRQSVAQFIDWLVKIEST